MRRWISSTIRWPGNHLAATGAVLTAAVLIFEHTGIDLWLQDHFYQFDQQRWRLDRDQPLLRFLLYDGIKGLYVAGVLALMVTLIFFRHRAPVRRHRRGLAIVLLSALTVPLVVGYLKDGTNVPCPKDLVRYGGDYPHITVLNRNPKSYHPAKHIRCYPAGHASGGFSLLSLAFLSRKRSRQLLGLGTGLLPGWTTGFYKMLIGDHFLSHTVVTMVLAWLLILLIAAAVDRLPQALSRRRAAAGDLPDNADS